MLDRGSYANERTVKMLSGHSSVSKTYLCKFSDLWRLKQIWANAHCSNKNDGDFVKIVCLQGDSGGPLSCPREDGNWHVAGVTSWIPTDCTSPKKPSVYTSVYALRQWITQNTGLVF